MILFFDIETGAITQIRGDLDPAGYEDRPDVLINPDIPHGIESKYLKVSASQVVEMTETEKADILAAEAEALRLQAIADIEALRDVPVFDLVRAVVSCANRRLSPPITMDEIVLELKREKGLV
ncbi:MAG: hypothetical protein HGA78_07780 [Nitrospirales bacterium]|nr:hypothetical protein [Nitrospirales bacterium]